LFQTLDQMLSSFGPYYCITDRCHNSGKGTSTSSNKYKSAVILIHKSSYKIFTISMIFKTV